MSGVTDEDPKRAAGSGSGGGGGSSGSGGDGHARRRFDDKALVARTSLILWHTHQNDAAAAVRKLLEEDGTLVNAHDYDSRTPLHVAALHRWQEVAECLIANGADVNALDRWHNTVRCVKRNNTIR
jgi:hypothetical protein